MNTPDSRITTLLAAYRDGTTTPRDVIFAARQRALEQREYNTWITLLDETQLQTYLDALPPQPCADLPLYGIPFAIKDNIDLAGVPTTAACPAFAYTPETSATVVDLLIAAGAIPLGKTNLDQFATGLVGTRSPYGEVSNAFNTIYISGGSSSGSAVATALGQVSFALGTDTAGSGRVPAVLNNLVGLKPTRGIISTRGVVPACRTLDCVSLFTQDCADAALLFNIVTQFDNADPFARGNPPANRARYFPAATPAFRFGVPATIDFGNNPDIGDLFAQAVADCKALGGVAVSIDFAPFHQTAELLYAGPWVAERALATRSVPRGAMLPVLQEILATADNQSASAVFAAQYRLVALKRECDALLAGLDFVLTPTTTAIYRREEITAEPLAPNAQLGTYTNFMNLLDYCATAIPVGFTTCGVPWGVTLFAPAFNDIRVLGFADRLLRRCRNEPERAASTTAAPTSMIDVVVCGAHLAGQPLNWQLTERGGVLQQLTSTAPHYTLYALADGKRPALVRSGDAKHAIEVEVWALPAENVGSFVDGIPAPLGIGKVELADGRWVTGFICDGYGLADVIDISSYGSWRGWLAAR